VWISLCGKMIDPQKCKSTIACALGTGVHARLITSFPWTSAQCAVYSHVQSIYRGVHLCLWNYIRLVARDASAKNISVQAEWLRQSGCAPSEPSEWTRSIRAVRDTPVADYSAPGVNTTRRVAYRPPIAVSPFLLALSVSYFRQTLWRCGQL